MIRLLIELFIAAFGLAVVVTQVIIPLFKGTVLFPFFRNKKKREIEHEFVDVATELETRELASDLEDFKRNLKEEAPIVETETKEK